MWILLSLYINSSFRPSTFRNGDAFQFSSANGIVGSLDGTVPSVLVSLPAEEYTTTCMQLAKMYDDDLPSPDCVESELHCWQLKWQKQLRENGSASLPTTLSSTLRLVTPMYPNIQVLITIMCTLPVTSCSAERSFSGLKRIKTPLRSSMIIDRTDTFEIFL